MKINIALLLEDNTEAATINYSKKLSDIYDSTYVLGINSIPHISILQTECSEDELDLIWQHIEAEITLQIPVTFAGLCILPTNTDNVWLEIPILKSEGIDKLQKDLLNQSILKDKKVFNGIINSFRPHVTVGFINNFYEKKILIPVDNKLLRKEAINTNLSIGIVGENFTYTKILKQRINERI